MNQDLNSCQSIFEMDSFKGEFHMFWSKMVGSPNYVKEEWILFAQWLRDNGIEVQ